MTHNPIMCIPLHMWLADYLSDLCLWARSTICSSAAMFCIPSISLPKGSLKLRPIRFHDLWQGAPIHTHTYNSNMLCRNRLTHDPHLSRSWCLLCPAAVIPPASANCLSPPRLVHSCKGNIILVSCQRWQAAAYKMLLTFAFLSVTKLCSYPRSS